MTEELTQFGPRSESDVARRERLAREVGGDIVAAAYLRGTFELPSGESSDYYFDKYLFETKPTILRRIAEMIAAAVPEGVDRLAGADGGGVALAAAVSLETGLPFVILLPETDAPVRGELHAGERVFVLADVVDSGSHVVRALDVVAGAGGTVTGVVSVIDREAGGTEAIAATSTHYRPLYRLRDLDVGPNSPKVRLDPADLEAALSGRPIPSGGADPLLDPALVEQVGLALAALLGEQHVDNVMVWSPTDAVLLGHVVAREVGARLVRGLEVGGVLDIEGSLESDSRVAILDSGSIRSVRQMIALIRNRDAVPVAVLAASANDDDDVEGVPVLSRDGK